MTRIGWLVDIASSPGGAELTQAEFRAAAPGTVEIVDCPAGHIDTSCDRYVIHNCVQYEAAELAEITDRPVVKYWHDVGPHLQAGVRDALVRVTHVCCSPVQADYMGLDARYIPPPVDLSRFEEAAASVNGDRAGTVSVGSWRNYGKAAHKAAEWAQANQISIDFFGDGVFRPQGSEAVPYDAMPHLLAQYERFVFLPMVLEPFGRLVVEAWAAGCSIVTNNLVGAKWWIENQPDAIDTAADDFWQVVLS